MKKIKFMFAIVLSLFLMTGCIKYDATMEVKKDKSMDFKIIYAMDMSMLGDLNDTSSSSSNSKLINDDQKKELEKQGYTVKEYKDDKYQGMEVNYSVKNIDDISKTEDFELDLSKMLEENSDNNHFFTVKKGFLKNTYKANYKFNNSAASSSSSSDDDVSIDTSELMKSMEMKFKVILPNGATTNNATTVDGNTYTWDLKEAKNELKFEFDMYNMTNIYYLIGGAVLAIAIIVGIIVLSTRKKV